jgi:four helix bundle protein
MDLVEEVYRVTEKMPSAEMYGLTSQMRRSAVSVPSNIAEGAARNSSKELLMFLNIAMGSLAEQLILAERLNFLTEIPLETVTEIRKMLVGLVKSIKNK